MLLHSPGGSPFKVHRRALRSPMATHVLKPKFDFSAHTATGGVWYRLSRCILLALRTRTFQGPRSFHENPVGRTRATPILGGIPVWTAIWYRSATHVLAGDRLGRAG